MIPIVSVVTNDRKSSLLYHEQLYSIFNNNLIIQLHSVEEGNIDKLIGDIILVSTFSLLTKIKPLVKDSSKIVVADLSLKKTSIEILDNLNEDEVLFVNYNAEMTMNSISQVYQCGYNRLKLIPYYPGVIITKHIDTAITPGETDIVPDFCKNIIDIGHRVLSLNTITEIAIRLNQKDIINEEILFSYFQEILNRNIGFNTYIPDKNKYQLQLEILSDELGESVINIDKSGNILYANSKAKQIFLISNTDNNVFKIIDIIDKNKLKNMTNPLSNIEFTYKDLKYLVSIYPLQYYRKNIEYLLVINKSQPNTKNCENNNITEAFITFDDIIGTSTIQKNSVDIAKKIALSDMPVYIYGETGTGKGLFAEAIHNYSFRKTKPFIVINCAAIPENLLESELFGYEDGAFTGARKGGKIGYFELAKDGTIFLDEINSLSYNLQPKILRVIENKRYRRVGGTRLLSMDARIISSSNVDLMKMVSLGKFREDLYYRLNVLSLHISPLRHRPEDLDSLIKLIMKNNIFQFEISPRVMDEFYKYPWKGNVRELQNVICRLSILNKKLIEYEDLALINFIENRFDKSKSSISKENLTSEEIQNSVNNYYKHNILLILKDTYNQTGVGRETIRNALMDLNINISDSQLRTILKSMELNGLININKGRAGTSISKDGYEKLLQEGEPILDL